jgi:hypothetical protein
MNLFKITYNRTPNTDEVRYVIAEDRINAINISQPYYEKNRPMDYNRIEIQLLCPASKIINKAETPHVIENES